MFKLISSSTGMLCLGLLAAVSSGSVAAISREAASRCDATVQIATDPSPSGARENQNRDSRSENPLPDAVGVLVAIDGVRYQDVFLGADDELLAASDPRRGAGPESLVPNLHRMARERGAALGAPGRGPMRAAGPAFLSLPGYSEILTGRFPSSCRDNRCPPITERTLIDELASVHDSEFPVAAVASWDGIARAAASRPELAILSAGRRGALSCGPLQRDARLQALWQAGSVAAPAPGHGNYRRDAHTATLGVELLRRHSPRFLFLGLGDTDEYAHRGNYAGYLDALGFADSIVGQLDAELESLEARGVSTLLIVTTDHGRGRGFAGHGGDPASARVWLVASGSLVTARGSLDASRPLRLADIAPTFRLLFGLNPDVSPKAGTVLSELLQPAPSNRTLLID